MNYTRADVINALVAEWEYLCHDDYDPEDQTPEEYREDLIKMTIRQLVEETDTDPEMFSLDEYMEHWG